MASFDQASPSDAKSGEKIFRPKSAISSTPSSFLGFYHLNVSTRGTGSWTKVPVIFLDLVEKLSKGELPKNDYPCMNDPSPTFHGSSGAASNPTNPTSAPHSMRQRGNMGPALGL